MQPRHHRFAGLIAAPRRERHKNMFDMPGANSPPPTPPTPAPPPTMPDFNSPASIEARRQAMAKQNQGGRQSTVLTSAMGTLAGSYAGTKTGG